MLATLCDGSNSTGNAKIAGRKDNSVRALYSISGGSLMGDRLRDAIARAAANPVGPDMRILPGICVSAAKIAAASRLIAVQESQENNVGAVARITCPCFHRGRLSWIPTASLVLLPSQAFL